MNPQYYKYLPYQKDEAPLTKWVSIFLVLFTVNYQLIEPGVGLGVIKVAMLVVMCIMFFRQGFGITKATVIGIIYVLYQFLQASFFPGSLRWSTLFFSVGLVFTYVSYYNMLYLRHAFTVDQFLRVIKWLMMAFFVVCIAQQVCLAVGIHNFPLINLVRFLNRGIGTNSLSMEPSSFARTMLVCYYAYIKCNEYKRGCGPYSIRELFSGEHKWVSWRFLWMMTTMGSSTAYFCLMLLSLYFIRRNNWFIIIPTYLLGFIILAGLGIHEIDRVFNVIDSTATLDPNAVRATDTSAAVRINPWLNTLRADFFKPATWFGSGIDSSQADVFSRTLFNDYGFVLYILALILDFSCAYRFFSLGCIMMFAGVAGGAGNNIWYAWDLMMIMTGIRYFYYQRKQFDKEIARSHGRFLLQM